MERLPRVEGLGARSGPQPRRRVRGRVDGLELRDGDVAVQLYYVAKYDKHSPEEPFPRRPPRVGAARRDPHHAVGDALLH
jgi:hypothetical protein